MIAALFFRGAVEVPVEAVVAGVDLAADEPLRVRRVASRAPASHGLNQCSDFGLLGPEGVGVVLGPLREPVALGGARRAPARRTRPTAGNCRVSFRTLVMFCVGRGHVVLVGWAGCGHRADRERWDCASLVPYKDRASCVQIRPTATRTATEQMMTDTFTIGLVQMKMRTGPRHEPREGRGRDRGRGEAGRADRLPAGAVHRATTSARRRTPRSSTWPSRSPGRATERLAAAAKANGVVVVGSLFEKRMAGVYHNTATVHDADGQLLGIYRKMHIPDDPLFLEKFYFTPGDLGLQGVRHASREGRHARLLGPVVPGGGPADGAAGGGGDLLPDGDRLAPAGEGRVRRGAALRVGDEHARPRHRQRHVRRARSTASATRVIVGEGLEFWGASFVSDPFGRMLASGQHATRKKMLVVKCDRKLMEDVRRNWPFFRDRRIDAYGGITKRVAD